jgi:hypothetical protein
MPNPIAIAVDTLIADTSIALSRHIVFCCAAFTRLVILERGV